ncbi:hypothetical protein [Staphylococcus phage PT1-4]
MEFKQVWLYTGEPYLAFKIDGEFQYPNDEWTDVQPPEGIYQPFYFNGDEWVGSTKEEYEKSLIKEEAASQPSTSEMMMASTQMQVAESSFQLRDTQKQLAQSMLENAEKDKRIESLEQQQAQILLELTEMKGEN